MLAENRNPHRQMAASLDTPPRLVRSIREKVEASLQVFGIDDWAWRKGHHYGATLIDIGRHRSIDILPDRETATVIDRLRRHVGLRVITRDRAQGHIDIATAGAPQTYRVPDRWHILKNFSEVLERFFERHLGWTLSSHGEQKGRVS